MIKDLVIFDLMPLSICLNCNTKYIKVRIDQKYCKRLCSLQHRYKLHKSSQYSTQWRFETLKKKLNKLDENKIKILFKKTKKEILANGYDPKINKKLTKIIGFEKWRKSEKGKETLKRYFNKDEVKEKRKKYNSRADIKIIRNQKRRAYDQTEKGQQRRIKNYLKQKSKPDFRDKANAYRRKKEKNDPIFKMNGSLRRYINKTLKIHKSPKYHKLNEVLGCSVYELKKYLETKFQPGMTWENHGLYGWHIDHIKPLSKFNMLNSNEQKKAFHYTNLQPLWAKDNLKKGNKY